MDKATLLSKYLKHELNAEEEATFKALLEVDAELQEEVNFALFFKSGHQFSRKNAIAEAVAAELQADAINVTPIAIPHDAGPTFGFQFEYQGIKAGFFTDLGSTEVLEKWVPDMHYLILEANYDPEMLNQGPYPQALINRIAGPKGHLSNNQSAELLKKSASNNLQELILAHLSKHNNNPQIALKTIKPHVEDKVNVTVAPAIGPLSIGY